MIKRRNPVRLLLAVGVALALTAASRGYGQNLSSSVRAVQARQGVAQDVRTQNADAISGSEFEGGATSPQAQIPCADSPDDRHSKDTEGKSWVVRFIRGMTTYGTHLSSSLLSLGTLPELTRGVLARKKQHLLSPEELNTVQWGGSADDTSGSDRPFREQGGEARIRVLTWNVNRGVQYKKILEALRREMPADIYLLQEVDCFARRTRYRNVAKGLANELGLRYVYGIEFEELAQRKSAGPALHGQAIISRFPIARAHVLRFVHQPKDWSRDWFQPRYGGRMALVAEIHTPAGPLIVYDTHLESRGNDEGRARQMQEILSDIVDKGYNEPLLIAGDLNTLKEGASPVIQYSQQAGFTDVLFRSNGSKGTNRRGIHKDWILTKGLVAVSASIHSRIQGSNHNPVSAELEIRD